MKCLIFAFTTSTHHYGPANKIRRQLETGRDLAKLMGGLDQPDGVGQLALGLWFSEKLKGESGASTTLSDGGFQSPIDKKAKVRNTPRPKPCRRYISRDWKSRRGCALNCWRSHPLDPVEVVTRIHATLLSPVKVSSIPPIF